MSPLKKKKTNSVGQQKFSARLFIKAGDFYFQHGFLRLPTTAMNKKHTEF